MARWLFIGCLNRPFWCRRIAVAKSRIYGRFCTTIATELKPEAGVRVRYAPSPTGFLHLGGLRTALYNFLFAQRSGGKFILRIEDTDQNRFVDGSVEDICETLKWCGMYWDEGPIYQSSRLALYREYVDVLLEKGHAYKCFCTAEELAEMRQGMKKHVANTLYDRRCLHLTDEQIQLNLEAGKPYTVRMKVPRDQVTDYRDLVKGRLIMDHQKVDDQVIMKSDGFPTYHLASVVDDHDMKISHVIRGEEWVASMPKHLLLYKMLGWKPPQFAHLPLLLNEDRSKLSKRQRHASVESYHADGYDPAALVNFAAFIGWTPPKEVGEILTMEQLIKEFDITRLHKSNAIVNPKKMLWFNTQHVRSCSGDRYEAMVDRMKVMLRDLLGHDTMKLYSDEYVRQAIKIAKERFRFEKDIARVTYFFVPPDLDSESAMKARKRAWKDGSEELLEKLIVAMEDIPEDGFTAERISAALARLAEHGPSPFFIARYALTGEAVGPEMPLLVETLGRSTTLDRLRILLQREHSFSDGGRPQEE